MRGQCKQFAFSIFNVFFIYFLDAGQAGHQYEIDDKFFAPYGEQDFTNVHANVKLTLDKKNGFMLLKFDIDGTADAACDRCGNPLTMRLWEEFNIVVKTNERAVRLWQEIGFKIIGEIPEAFQHPTLGLVNAYIMYQKL